MSEQEITIRAQTALQQAGVNKRQFNSATLEMKEIESAAMLLLHSLDSPALLAPGMLAAGITIPTKTGQAEGEDPAALCLRPGEWLFFSESLGPAQLQRKLQPVIDPSRTTLNNTSDAYAVFRLSGAGTPWLLAKLSCLDFLAGSCAGQHCARTRMAHAAVLVHYHKPADSEFCFDLIFDRSIAKYMWALLTDSAPHADELTTNFGGTL